jgi:hypothetical protein
VRKQVGRVVAAVVVVGGVVSGCGSGPSQTGSAVIVGSDAIPLSVVQDQIAVALSPERAPAVQGINAGRGGGFGPPEVAREIVTDKVLSELLDRRIAEEGIVVDDALVDRTIASMGSPEEFTRSSLYAPDAAREQLRDDIGAALLGARYIDRLGATFEFTGFSTEDEALAAAQAVVAGGPGAEAVFADAPPEGQAQEVRGSTNPALASSFAFGTPAGSAIVLRPAQDGAPWVLIHVIERNENLPPAGESVVGQLGQQDLELIGYRMLQPAAAELGIEVNPRYGVWDPIQLAVTGADQTAGTIVLPPAPE